LIPWNNFKPRITKNNNLKKSPGSGAEFLITKFFSKRVLERIFTHHYGVTKVAL